MYSSDSLRAILEMEIVNAHYRGARKASHLIPTPTSYRCQDMRTSKHRPYSVLVLILGQACGVLVTCYLAVVILALASLSCIYRMAAIDGFNALFSSQGYTAILVIGINDLILGLLLWFVHDSKNRLLQAIGWSLRTQATELEQEKSFKGFRWPSISAVV